MMLGWRDPLVRLCKLRASPRVGMAYHELETGGCAGPGKAWTAREQGEYLFELAGRRPSFIQVPVALMDGIIGCLDALARIFPGLEAGSRCLLVSPRLAIMQPCAPARLEISCCSHQSAPCKGR